MQGTGVVAVAQPAVGLSAQSPPRSKTGRGESSKAKPPKPLTHTYLTNISRIPWGTVRNA